MKVTTSIGWFCCTLPVWWNAGTWIPFILLFSMSPFVTYFIIGIVWILENRYMQGVLSVITISHNSYLLLISSNDVDCSLHKIRTHTKYHSACNRGPIWRRSSGCLSASCSGEVDILVWGEYHGDVPRPCRPAGQQHFPRVMGKKWELRPD
jgi:hypothetical protein